MSIIELIVLGGSMKKQIFKILVSVMLVAICMTAMVSVVSAETKEFNVTATNVSGYSSADPYTPRAQKSMDGDTKYYVRVLTMSGSCYFVEFYMNKYDDTNFVDYTTYSYPMCYLRSSVGELRSQTYSGSAPGGHYYFLKCVPYYGYANINVTGRFTP